MVDDINCCPKSLTLCWVKRELGKGCKSCTYRMSWGNCGNVGCLVSN